MNKPAILLLVLLIPGLSSAGLDLSVSMKQFTGDTHPFLPDRFFMYSIGNSFPVAEGLNIIARGGYGSGTPDKPEHGQGHYIDDQNGRIWAAEAGVEYRFLQEYFFVRGTAGRACLLLDYVESDSSGVSVYRITESEWKNTLSIGLGSGYSFLNLLLAYEILGPDHSLVSGEIGVSF